MATKGASLLAFILGVLLVLVGASSREWPGPVVAPDVQQERLDQALPPLRESTARQTVVPHHDGLTEIEVLVARYPSATGEGALTLRLLDDVGQIVATRRWESAPIANNEPLVLRFAPQPGSAGRPYTLEASGSATLPLSLWGYRLDVIPGDFRLSGAESEARELRVVTRYALQPRAAMAILARMLREGGALLLLALLFLPLPGALLLLFLPPRHTRGWDPIAWGGVGLALGLALWPLFWFWLSAAGGRWNGPLLWLVLIAGWVLLLWGAWRRGTLPQLFRLPSPATAIMLLFILPGALAVRLLAVRDLLLPPWVDAVRHGLITAILVDRGALFSSYEPWLPVEGFPYHFGFHVLPASLILMGGWPLPRTLLLLGQLVNALAPLAVYAGCWFLLRRRGAALVAAFLVAFPFLFPGYYATWGRYTQGTGMLLMPLLVAWSWRVVRGGRRARGEWGLLALLASGLFLVHLRLFLFWLPFPLLVWVGSRFRHTRALLGAGAATVGLVGPRAWQLLPSGGGAELTSAGGAYNLFPVGYLMSGWERLWVAVGAASVLLAGWNMARGRRGGRVVVALAAWVGVLFALLAGERVGLPETWLVNLNSMYITLFFPLALVIGVLAELLWRVGGRWGRLAPLRYGMLGALTTALLLFGIPYQIRILNQQTILARAPDAAALAWVDSHLPADARLAVGAWQWLGTTWSATDGGAWLLPLTRRWSSTPPADYQYSPALAVQVAEWNRAAQARDWADPASAAWLRAQGYTHIFVGARGGFFDPATLARNPALRLLYSHEGAFVWEVGEQGSGP